MSDYKYIVFKDKHGRRFPVIFPAEMVHSHVAEAVQNAVRMDEIHARPRDFSFPKPVSAGFVSRVGAYAVNGDSESLGLKSHADDLQLINTYPYTKGL